MTKLRIDIVSDVVCPWCIIGYKQLERALADLEGEVTAEIHWHPFELNPNMPAEGQNLREHLAQKYGTTQEQSIAARKRLTELGASLGFSFDYFDEMRMVNTFKAHQLLHWAKQWDKQTALKLRLFAAFFGERKDISNEDCLVQEAVAVGLDETGARSVLAESLFSKEVKAESADWMGRGIHAVPAVIFNERFLVSGAQEAGFFKAQIEKLLVDSV